MKIADLIPSFTAFKSSTTIALDETKAALAVANANFSSLKAELDALKAAAPAKANDSTSDDSGDAEDSQLDSLLSDLQAVLDKYTADESSDSDSSDDSSDSTDDSTSDDSDDTSDETAKATKVEKIKALTKKAEKIVAASKKLKASVPTQVIRELASVGIPTPIATKHEANKAPLKGLDRVAAAFAEQLNNKK